MGVRDASRKDVALLEWNHADGIAEVLAFELERLGYRPLLLHGVQSIPSSTTFVLTFGPYGKCLEFLSQLDRMAPVERPVSVHWNTEGIPDLRLPWPLIRIIGRQRSWMDRLFCRLPDGRLKFLLHRFSLSILPARLQRFRYVGDLYYAYRRSWIHVLGDTSLIYSTLRTRSGLPTLFAPWGVTEKWYADLKLERDIDVLWMGKMATARRSRILYRLRDRLRSKGINVYMADDEESPFVFGDARTEILNRAKITVNVTRTWYDDNFSRFIMAAPNRSLIVSETLLPHCPYFEPGIHYVGCPVEALEDTIGRFLEDNDKRSRIVDNCYKLVMKKLTLRSSMQTMMKAAEEKSAAKGSSGIGE